MSTRITTANRVTWIGFWSNLLLTSFKLIAGVIGHSGAMIADSIHSLSDLATDIVVLVSFKVVGKPIDRSHDYGHGKYETLATAIIGGSLVIVGAGIFWVGGSKVFWHYFKGVSIPPPGRIALLAAAVSILVKEALFRYTSHIGKRINSQAVIANAWHHRSDALSSIGALLGIGGAIVLGPKWTILDPIAAIVVSIFIIKVGLGISTGSVKELCEESLSEELEAEILEIATAVQSASDAHNLRTRRIANDIAIDLHIRVDPEMHVVDAHVIACDIENRLRVRFGKTTFISIHVEPFSMKTLKREAATENAPAEATRHS